MNMKEGQAMATQRQFGDDQRRLPGKRPRLMIDISPELRRHIKIAAHSWFRHNSSAVK